jgi:hypothetical protein
MTDYNNAYKNYEMCPNCNRKTPDGIEAYKNRKSGKLTKTCRACRDCVLKSVTAKVRYDKRMTLRQQNEYLKVILRDHLNQEAFNALAIKYPKLSTVIPNQFLNKVRYENEAGEEADCE